MGQDVVGTIVQLPKVAMTETGLGKLSLGQRVWSPAAASFAEYTTAQWWKVAPLPANVEPRDGVSMCTVALTALALTREAYAVKKGDYILVRAAAGGVGLVLVQVSTAPPLFKCSVSASRCCSGALVPGGNPPLPEDRGWKSPPSPRTHYLAPLLSLAVQFATTSI